MFKNYMKIALKVLARRKFFTFISLFGISFTLVVLNIATSFLERDYSNDSTEKNMDKILVTNYLNLMGYRNHRNGYTSVPMLKKYFTDIESAESYTIFSDNDSFISFLDGKKYKIKRQFIDAKYWNLFTFDFISGKPFLEDDLDRGSKVVIINEYIKNEFFPNRDALGEIFEIEGESFRVIGVVKNVSIKKIYNYADIWIPYTSLNENLNTDRYNGDYRIAYLFESSEKFPGAKEEFKVKVKSIPIKTYDHNQFDTIVYHLETKHEAWLRSNYGGYDDDGASTFYWSTLGLLAAFILLPVLNLININISRIMERTSEIGVRKSFGASSKTLVYQFVIENIILTIIGGIIALLLTAFFLSQLSNLNIIRFENFHINISVFLIGMGFTILFGFLSGVLPAYKMAKLNPVDALKGAVK